MSGDAQQGHSIETMQLEERRYPPGEEFAAQANARPDIYQRDFEEFWGSEARERISWFEPFDRLYEWQPPYAKWFLGGKLNVSYNCIDRHVEAGKGDKVAYFWEGEPAGERREQGPQILGCLACANRPSCERSEPGGAREPPDGYVKVQNAC